MNAVFVPDREPDRCRPRPSPELDPADELKRIVSAKSQLFRIQFLCASPAGLSLLNQVEIRATDVSVGRSITAHGFRATFRTWAEEVTRFPHAVIEEAMGHQVGNQVERAYRRTGRSRKAPRAYGGLGELLRALTMARQGGNAFSP